YRLDEIEYDFDQNTIVDATRTFSYDATGHVTMSTYLHPGDFTPDLFNSEDEDLQEETTVVTFDGNDLADTFEVTRIEDGLGTIEIDSALTFAGGDLTRVDGDRTFFGQTFSFFANFLYAGGRIDQISGGLIGFWTFTHDGDVVPDTATVLAGDLTVDTAFTFRPDGKIDLLVSTATEDGLVVGGGSGDYVYDANGRLTDEIWTFTGAPSSSPYAEFQNTAYRKSYAYAADGLKLSEAIDVGDDGSVEATRTFSWEPGPCVDAFNWAPNGPPNFVLDPTKPYVPGTGAFDLQVCPEPG
ncbi:unnamed protein product, partial [Discosporangium mesarthrocarpum]